MERTGESRRARIAAEQPGAGRRHRRRSSSTRPTGRSRTRRSSRSAGGPSSCGTSAAATPTTTSSSACRAPASCSPATCSRTAPFPGSATAIRSTGRPRPRRSRNWSTASSCPATATTPAGRSRRIRRRRWRALADLARRVHAGELTLDGRRGADAVPRLPGRGRPAPTRTSAPAAPRRAATRSAPNAVVTAVRTGDGVDAPILRRSGSHPCHSMPESQALLRSAARIRRRPGLRTVVVAPAVAVIVGMAIVVSNSVADELRRSATESAVHNVEAIVRGYVDPELDESSLDLDAPRDPGDRRPARAPDPVGRDPPDQHLVPRRPDRLFERARAAAAGASRSARCSRAPSPVTASPATSMRRATATAARAPATACRRLPGSYLELFVPIRGAVDGNPIGVYDVYQDARLIEERIDATRSGVFVVALVASSLLVALIWLAFGGASRVLAGQNRRLQEQATTERLLLVDLRRSEERFRSLVRNASDGVVVLGEDGHDPLREPGRRADPRASRRRTGSAGRRRPRRPPGRPVDRRPPARRRRGRERIARSPSSSAPATPTARGGRSRRSPRTCSTTRPSAASSSTTATSPSARRSRSSSATRRSTTSLTGLANRALFLDRLGHALARAARGAQPDRGPVPRPRRLQGGQRQPRPRRGRPAARRGRGTAALARPAPATRSPGWAATSSRSSSRRPSRSRPTQAARADPRRRWPSRSSSASREVVARASIGIAIQTADGGDADELLRNADIAMYAAKARGGDCHVTYEPQLLRRDRGPDGAEGRPPRRPRARRARTSSTSRSSISRPGAITGSRRCCAGTIRERGVDRADRVHPAGRGDRADRRLGRWVLETACRQTASLADRDRAAGPDDQRQPVGPPDRRPGPGRATSRRVLAASGLRPATPDPRDHRERPDPGRRGDRRPRSGRSRRSASASRSTTSGPATRRSATCGSSRSTSLKIDRSFVNSLDEQRRLAGPRPLDPEPQLDAAARSRRRRHRDVRAARRSCVRWVPSGARGTCSPGRCDPGDLGDLLAARDDDASDGEAGAGSAVGCAGADGPSRAPNRSATNHPAMTNHRQRGTHMSSPIRRAAARVVPAPTRLLALVALARDRPRGLPVRRAARHAPSTSAS